MVDVAVSDCPEESAMFRAWAGLTQKHSLVPAQYNLLVSSKNRNENRTVGSTIFVIGNYKCSSGCIRIFFGKKIKITFQSFQKKLENNFRC
jgi:hypothetical protein